MIVRKGQPPADQRTEERAERHGAAESLRYSDAGGLTQFGAHVRTLEPGSRSSDRHWHGEEDGSLCVVSGEATAVEDDGAHLLYPGDAACRPAGSANAHRVVNRSGEPCAYLIFGPRMARDAVHCPVAGKVLYDEDGEWRLHRSDDGSLIGGGEIEQVRPMTWRGPEANRAP